MTMYCVAYNVGASWYIRRRRVGEAYSEVVATGFFYFNQSGVHTAMPTLHYIDLSRTLDNIEYFIVLGNSAAVDMNDTCTITTLEYY